VYGQQRLLLRFEPEMSGMQQVGGQV